MPGIVVKLLLAGISRLIRRIKVCHKEYTGSPGIHRQLCLSSGAHNVLVLGNCDVFSYNTVVRAGAAGVLNAFRAADWEIRYAVACVN